MLKKIFLVLFIFYFSGLMAQENSSLYVSKKIVFQKDTIKLEKVSINSSYFTLKDSKNNLISTAHYQVDFQNGFVILKEEFFNPNDSLTIDYLKYPDFLTKEYKIYDSSNVATNDITTESLYKINNGSAKKVIPFDGLETSGSITRGITIGNNQNAVLNSNLDLQITGKLSEKVSLRASLQDSNIPIQNGGYSQKLDQFDNIFMELFSDKWNIRAGDLFLENHKTSFLNFNKKVQGLSLNFDLGNEENKTNIFASAALVRGQYAKSSFKGTEGNQGPYKLKGQNGELYVLVISGSERVYVNGRQLKRGENNDYTIDYNAGEITFTPLFTITSEMRIVVEYQFTDRNYTRFVTYTGASHESKKWSLAGYLYSENDIKNQPVQQNLSSDQVQILANAGDDLGLMVAPSGYSDSYSDNKILYIKLNNNGVEYFEYSNNPDDELFSVSFSLLGKNRGNYKLKNSSSISKIYEYAPPINGILQGDYEPVIQLVAPSKNQVATFLGKYAPSEKTIVDFEVGVSNTDKNLFSTLDDKNNKGISSKIYAKQRLFSKNWQVDAFGKFQFIQKNFNSVERLYTIEFDRDWNIENTIIGNQSLLVSGLNFNLIPKVNTSNSGSITYQFEKLNFSESFSGSRHILDGFYKMYNWSFTSNGSYLNSDGLQTNSKFLRNQSVVKYNYKKNWIAASNRLEDNQVKLKAINSFSGLSQRFNEYGLHIGRGDSTKVFAELGYLKRMNDSIQSGQLLRVNNSDSYFFKSKLIQNSKSDLSIYANYRVLKYNNDSKKKESTLNSRVLYTRRFYNQLLQTASTYETNSGTLPQQEFTYVEVAAGQGVYMWNDYNNNGIKELQEFEVAPFVDQAKYIQVFLPNLVYLKTHQTKFSQSVVINPIQWQNQKGIKKMMSYFYNQTSFLLDRKTKSNGENFELNPFDNSQENILGLNSSFRNSLFYNRGKQNHSVTYTFIQNNAKNLLSVGSQESNNSSHQFQYTHLYRKSWLFNALSKTIQTDVISQNYPEKNYAVTGYQLVPKISYLFSKNTSWELFYEFQNKENQIGNSEKLFQNRFGTSFSYSGANKITMNSEVSFYQNKFTGNEFSSVGFQMLEGLQTGQNIVWKLLLQKNLSQFLDININYLGRKGEVNNTIHTGNIQLRAYF